MSAGPPGQRSNQGETVTASLQGPDDNLPINLGGDFVARIQVPSRKRLNVGFHVSGFNENDIIIYLADTLMSVIERRNYNRSQAFWQSDPNLGDLPETYVLSGWNKERPQPQGGGLPWRQSNVTVSQPDQFTTFVFFHDISGDPNSLGAIVSATIAE